MCMHCMHGTAFTGKECVSSGTCLTARISLMPTVDYRRGLRTPSCCVVSVVCSEFKVYIHAVIAF